jgi:hypothetical protein
MNLSEFRKAMQTYWLELAIEADHAKAHEIATHQFGVWYGALPPEERLLADKVLAEWVLQSDESTRQGDALFLLHQYKIRSALPAVERLSEALRPIEGPEAFYLRKKLLRLIDELRGDA